MTCECTDVSGCVTWSEADGGANIVNTGVTVVVGVDIPAVGLVTPGSLDHVVMTVVTWWVTVVVVIRGCRAGFGKLWKVGMVGFEGSVPIDWEWTLEVKLRL